MSLLFLFSLILSLMSLKTQAQNAETNSTVNIRGSFLLFPFTPLITLEFRTVENLTIQIESDFRDTHGVNLKYYLKERMQGGYLFIGNALLQSELLREDSQTVYLPYVGYGYALPFGKTEKWIWDIRFGLGSTTNADTNGVYPVIKTGVGIVF